MSRSKKITDAISELKRAIKDKDTLIKSLERQIKKLNEELSPKKEKKKVEVESTLEKCPACGKNTLKKVELGIRIMVSCTTCNHRIVVKRNG